MKISITTLGCKTNYCDSESLAMIFAQAGHEVELKLSSADICIINTRSVTGYSDHKSRQAVAKALRLNPKARVYIVGCSVENSLEQFGKYTVAGFAGVHDKEELAQKILSQIGNSGKVSDSADNNSAGGYIGRKRAFVKIQDGCDNYCTYCIVPYLRGASRSRSIDNIVAEAKQASADCGEIILSGINIAAYGRDLEPRVSLKDLIAALGVIPTPKRLGSLSPAVIDEDLLEAIAVCGVVTEFHMPLQSGSDRILALMGRRYTAAEYMDKVALIMRRLPKAVITTDVIVGFPSETEEDFAATVRIIDQAGFGKVHVFPFSLRPKTKAYGMAGRVDDRLIRERIGILQNILSNR